MNIDVDSLASYLADKELENKIELGELKFRDVWEKVKEEYHGEQILFEITKKGIQLHDELTSKWLEVLETFKEK